MNWSEEEGNMAPALFARGMFWLQRRDYKTALEALTACHRLGHRKNEIETLILEHIYAPHQEEFRRNYWKNTVLLRNYPHIRQRDYPDFDDLRYQFIPSSESHFVIYDRKNCEFNIDYKLIKKLDISQCEINEVILIKNEFQLANILACENKTRDPKPYLWMKIPLFLFYQDFNEFAEYLQVFDFSLALESERLVFFFGRTELEQYFSEPQALLPQTLLNIWDRENDDVVKFITEQHNRELKEIHNLQDRVAIYYAAISKKELLESIQGGNPRILFVTSRFTTALQYYIRDCVSACNRLGIANQLLIEKSDLHRIKLHDWLQVLDNFKPHIIFCIDHFRWESQFLPQNLIYLTWVQDILPNIASQESAARIGPLDFVLNVFVSNPNFLLDFGYPDGAIIEAPVVADPQIYVSCSLNEEERQQYRADLCVFSNPGNPQKGLEYFLGIIHALPNYDQLETMFKAAYREMYESFYREDIFYSLEDYKIFLYEFAETYGFSMPEQTLGQFAEIWRQEIGYRIFRSIPLEWLHEKDYDMKLWGREWIDHPLLSKYAQGVAANGETLSRIINACQIVIGTNPFITTHPRLFESILSNCFYLAYRIPEDNDWANIRRYLREDKEIVFAYNREDLYRKVDYYLENETERRQIVRSARKKILENLTYEALISRVLKEITLKLEEPKNGV